jgi:hypothetical protein
MLPFNPKVAALKLEQDSARRRREPALRRASRLPLRAVVVVARRHHSQMIRPVQVAEAIIVLVILFSLFKVVTVEV